MSPERGARDQHGRLRCQVPGCHAVIRGWTGLAELQNLRTHLQKFHFSWKTFDEVLETRAEWERRCWFGCGRQALDGHLTCGDVGCNEARARAER